MPSLQDFAPALIKTPNKSATSFYYGTAELAAFVSLAIPPGSSSSLVLGTSAVPIIALGRLGPVVEYSLFVSVTPDNSAGEIWHLHLEPWFLADADTLFFHTGNTTYTKLIARTHPASTATTETAYVASSATSATVIGGGGSEVTTAEAGKPPLVAPYMTANIKNQGATSTFTINSLHVWGHVREVS